VWGAGAVHASKGKIGEGGQQDRLSHPFKVVCTWVEAGSCEVLFSVELVDNQQQLTTQCYPRYGATPPTTHPPPALEAEFVHALSPHIGQVHIQPV
jgi:hypothetical protein